MIFRRSQKLNTKIKAGTLAALPLEDNPFADWSAGLFLVGRVGWSVGQVGRSGKAVTVPASRLCNSRSAPQRSWKTVSFAVVLQRRHWDFLEPGADLQGHTVA